MLEVVVGAPFAGKDRWIAAEIERRESAGELGLLALLVHDATALSAALVPGAESVYRDEEVSDSGSADGSSVTSDWLPPYAEAGRRTS